MNNIYRIEFSKGDEVIGKVNEELCRLGVSRGAVISLIGAVDSCCISNMDKSDAYCDIETVYSEPLEASGSGEIKDGEVHLHCVFGRQDNSAVTGHLHWAKVKSWFVAVHVISYD